MSRKIYIIIAMVFTVVLSVSTFFIIRNHIDSAKQNEVYDNLAEIVEDEPPKENEGVMFSEDKAKRKEEFKMSKIQFRNAAHRDFVLENLDKCKVNDCYHRAFFYVMGISEETRMNIGKMFDFKRDCIIPEGMHGGWQTSGTVKVCHLAFNLWNGFTEEGRENLYTPEELFCCGYAPYFMEGIKLRYPEYCRDLTPPKRNDMER